MGLVLCQLCKSRENKVEKEEAVRIDNKNFHPNCAKLYVDKKELYETICRIFGLKMPGPVNNTFISNFLKNGMTYKGINNTLVYFYEIKKNSVIKANKTIAIVPKIYEEAKKYYSQRKKEEIKAELNLEKNKEEIEKISNQTRKIKMPEPKPITRNVIIYTDDDYEI